MTTHVLQGPFLTRAQAARRAHVSPLLITHRPDLLRLGGTWLQEVYFAFQFDEHGVRPGIGQVVQGLKPRFDDIAIGGWLVRPNEELGLSSPLDWLGGGGDIDQVLAAAGKDGPEARAVPEADPAIPGTEHVLPETRRQRTPQRRRRHVAVWHSLLTQ